MGWHCGVLQGRGPSLIFPPSPRELAGEMLEFAKSHPHEAALEEALFSELGCYYRPSADQVSSREWLRAYASMLLKAAE